MTPTQPVCPQIPIQREEQPRTAAVDVADGTQVKEETPAVRGNSLLSNRFERRRTEVIDVSDDP